ncbi:hypothetical protein D3C77_781810 [compost metagenome]
MDVALRTQGRDAAVAAGPIWTSQAGIRQAHEGAEHDQVQGQEPGEKNKFAIPRFDTFHFPKP